MITGLIALASSIIGLFKAQNTVTETRTQAFANLTNNSNRLNSLWLDTLLEFFVIAFIYNQLALNFHWHPFITQVDPLQSIYTLFGLGLLKVAHNYVNKG